MDFSRPDNARKINRLKVLAALRHENMSKADLSRELGINKVSIGEIIDRMLEEGLIEEAGKTSAPSGRPATLLGIRPSSGRSLAIEIRSKAVSVSVSDAKGRILRFERFPRTESMMEDLARTIAKMRGDDARLYGAAVVSDEDIDLSSVIDAPINNISKIYAETSSELEKLDDPEDTLFVSWADEIEAAIYHDGIITLPQFAHIRAQRDGECECGGRGCLETAASGLHMIRKAGAKGYRDLITNPAGLETVRECLRPMATALSMAVQALSAERVVITGELSALPDATFEHLQNLVSSALPPQRNVTIMKAKAGEKGTREGAAILALDEFFYHTGLLTKLSAIERLASDFQSGI